MKILEEIANGFRKLFKDTGFPKFFIYAKSIERLNADIMGVEKTEIITEHLDLSV